MRTIFAAAVAMSTIGFAALSPAHADVVVKTPGVGSKILIGAATMNGARAASSVSTSTSDRRGCAVTACGTGVASNIAAVSHSRVRPGIIPLTRVIASIHRRDPMRFTLLAVMASLAGCTVSTYEPAPRHTATYVAPAPTATYVAPAPSYAPGTTTVIRSP
jgi:hypothetical protein